MKKIMLIIAAAFCLSAAAVQAQDPTPQPPTPEPPPDSTSIQPFEPSQPAEPTEPAYRKDMVKIEATEIPDGLKSTLERPQFKGWENGQVFANADKSAFIVEIRDDVENRTKVFRFDADGKPIKDN